MQSKQLSAVVLLTLLIIKSPVTAAAPAVKIYSLEESGDTKLSQPRIYIENLSSSVPISNFYYYYYFTVENGKTPAPPEDYYTPNSIPTLESLGNGNYRIKYTFLGVTIQPGEILPNTNGNVIGIHYTDWSEMDKTNDHSNNLSSTFALNPNIPAFLADGTPINGNPPPDPGKPPQPPPVSGSIGDFAVFSEECTDLRDRVKIIAGNVGSLIYTELGCNDTLYGDVLSVGSIFLRENARIYGNVTSSQSITEQNGVYVEDIKRSFAQLELPELQTPVVTYGTVSISVSPNDSYTLWPGMYDSFHAYANAKITIQPGEYAFREFILEPNDTILLNVDHGEYIDLLVKDNCSLGNGTIMNFPDGIDLPYSLSIRSAQTAQFYIGTDADIKGLIYAPDAEVHVYSRTEIKGSLYGKKVIVEPDVQLCKPPTLLSLSHSEGAMAPPFDPMLFNYLAVVPDITSTVTVTPQVMPGQTVTVNGNNPSDPVNLTGTETNINIQLTHPEGCGNTTYKLKVARSTNYQIFVDPNSPCTPGTEDGLSWQTAWKKIEDALTVSAQTGQELWLREGVYIPTVRINPSDPRSATFSIPCGTEIKGGFLGTETNGTPLGSAFNTILSGDINGDDTNYTTWPPSGSDLQYVVDNVYHVVTGNGNLNCTDSRINNVVISGAYANGTGTNSTGAGVYVKSGNLSLEFVAIMRNYSEAGGAGIYVTGSGSLNPLKHCLIQDNYSKTGSGAGLFYNSNKPLLIDGSVFDNNTTESTSSDQGGSAIYFKTATIEMVNCVVGQNKSHSINGAVLNDAGMLKVTNCTFAFNVSTGAVSITNVNSATSDVLNSILWNSASKDEVSETGFDIKYTCITKGYAGTDNFSYDPEFVNPSKPAGTDGKWGNIDDGVRLLETSPCHYWGTFTGAPTEDILEIERPNYGYGCDLGAYTYFPSNQNDMLGRLVNDNFIPFTNFPVVTNITNEDDINAALLQGKTRVLQIVVPKNKYTDKKNIITAEVVGVDAGGTLIGTTLSIPLYRIPGSQYFRSIAFDGGRRGKHLIFITDPSLIGEYTYAYALLGAQNGKFRVTVQHAQFK